MDKTNYSLLSIVGIVAITAIIAMFVRSGGFPDHAGAPRVEFVDSAAQESALVTGNVVLTGRVTEPQAPRARPEFDWSRYDYDGSGALDVVDSTLLGAVTDRTRFCPANKICDVDQNGVVELADLGLFNAKVLEQAMEREASQSLLTGQVTGGLGVHGSSDAAKGPGFWAATTGAPLP